MSDSHAEDEAAIQAVLSDSYRAWGAGDADGMVADYTQDATAIMTGSLRESRDVIRTNMAAAFAGPLKSTSTVNRQLSIRFLGTDVAIVISESGILFPGQTEVADVGKVNATWVFEKRGARWHIAAYHNSPVLALSQQHEAPQPLPSRARAEECPTRADLRLNARLTDTTVGHTGNPHTTITTLQ